MTAVLTLDDRRAADGRRAGRLTFGTGSIPIEFERPDGPLSTDAGADAFVLSAVLPAMTLGEDVHVEGPVSAELLRNLDDWQAAWHQWVPRYRPARFTADEVTNRGPVEDGGVLSAFSGGVDATFTAHRHLDGRDGVRPRLSAALLLQGADIPLDDHATFARAYQRAEKMLAEHGVPLLALRTNYRQVFTNWEHGFATAVAAGMALLQDQYSEGLIGSGKDVGGMVFPMGSNPVTDHLLSTGRMAIRNDGAGFSRTEKVAQIAGWAQARSLLRVCWQGDQLDRNCGRCEKCVRTILNFRAAGAGLPECFDRDVTGEQIRAVRLRGAVRAEMASILRYLKSRGENPAWAKDVRFAVRKSAARDFVTRSAFRFRVVRAAWSAARPGRPAPA